MANHNPSYEDLCQQRQEGQITDVEFVLMK